MYEGGENEGNKSTEKQGDDAETKAEAQERATKLINNI